MDGFQMLHELERVEQWRTIPVIVLSGRELSEAEERELQSHVTEYLVKETFSTTEFLKTIKRVLSIAHS
jgi:CheY-like chemotaxis protein